MSVEGNAKAYKLYSEFTPAAAIAFRARYDFARSQKGDNCGGWVDVGTNFGWGINEDNCPDIKLDINRKFLENQDGIRIQADGAALPFPSQSVGMVTLFEIIEHIPAEAGHKILNEALRIVKPDGKVIISTPNRGAYGERMSAPDHIQEFNREELNNMIEQSGLVVDKEYGQGFMTEGNFMTKLIRSARDSKAVSWIYYHAPIFLRNKLRVELQKAVRSNEIRLPNEKETIKNFVMLLKPNN